MDFISIKNSVERATIKAATAAKKLSLNEMAKNDEYIYSEGLKVAGGTHNSSTSRSNSSYKNKSNSVSKINGVGDNMTSNIMQLNDVSDIQTRTTTTMHNNNTQGVPIDRTTGTSKTNNFNIDQMKKQTIFKYKNNDNYNDKEGSVDSFDEEECDPILQMVKTERIGTHNNNTRNHIMTSISNKHYNLNGNNFNSSPSSNTSNRSSISTPSTPQHNKKDPNRFMTDLDARLTSPPSNTYVKSPLSKTAPQSVSPPQHEDIINNENVTSLSFIESFTSSDNKIDWLRNTFASQNALQNLIKFGGSTASTSHHRNNNDIEMANSKSVQNPNTKIIKTLHGENIHIVNSSSLALDNEENAELQRLMNRNFHSHGGNLCSVFVLMNMIESWIKKNRHYSIIILTFILTTVGYFYMRKKIDENT